MQSFDIDFDQQELPSPTKNKSAINQKLEEVTRNKYAAGTVTKGFFNQDMEQDQQNNFEASIKKNEQRTSEKKKQERERRRSKKGLITLEPLKQTKTTEVFENYSKKQETKQVQNEQVEQINTEKSSPEPKVAQRSYETRRMAMKRLNSSRKESQIEKKQNVSPKIPLKSIASPLFFHEDQGQIQQTNQLHNSPTKSLQSQRAAQLNKPEQPVRIAQNVLVRQVFQQSEDSDQEPMLAPSGYFSYSSLHVFKKQLSEPLKRGTLLRLEMVRDKDGFNTFWPQFHLYFCSDKQYVMSAKKTSSKPSSTFIISISKGSFQQNSDFYLGKMKSNLLGDVLNVYGPGLNPSNAQSNNEIPRQMLATIVYDSHIFQMGKPRQFQVFVKKQQYRYYSSFPQVKLYGDEIPLSQLYDYPQNKQKIKVYRNRKPTWLQQIGGYMLNFKGRVEAASIKNFILEDRLNGPETMIFGKVTDSKFNLDMAYPISPIIAFAVALSSFDSRIMCE